MYACTSCGYAFQSIQMAIVRIKAQYQYHASSWLPSTTSSLRFTKPKAASSHSHHTNPKATTNSRPSPATSHTGRRPLLTSVAKSQTMKAVQQVQSISNSNNTTSQSTTSATSPWMDFQCTRYPKSYSYQQYIACEEMERHFQQVWTQFYNLIKDYIAIESQVPRCNSHSTLEYLQQGYTFVQDFEQYLSSMDS